MHYIPGIGGQNELSGQWVCECDTDLQRRWMDAGSDKYALLQTRRTEVNEGIVRLSETIETMGRRREVGRAGRQAVMEFARWVNLSKPAGILTPGTGDPVDETIERIDYSGHYLLDVFQACERRLRTLQDLLHEQDVAIGSMKRQHAEAVAVAAKLSKLSQMLQQTSLDL